MQGDPKIVCPLQPAPFSSPQVVTKRLSWHVKQLYISIVYANSVIQFIAWKTNFISSTSRICLSLPWRRGLRLEFDLFTTALESNFGMRERTVCSRSRSMLKDVPTVLASTTGTGWRFIHMTRVTLFAAYRAPAFLWHAKVLEGGERCVRCQVRLKRFFLRVNNIWIRWNSSGKLYPNLELPAILPNREGFL